jgi:hypothetical protein
MPTPVASSRQPLPNRASCAPYRPQVYNKRSKQRFERDRTRQLIRHLDREPSYPERILISRIVAVEWDLRRIDARLDAGQEISGHAMRARLAGETRLRLDLRELGLAPSGASDPRAAGRAALDGIPRVEYTIVDPKMREADEKPTAPAAVEYVLAAAKIRA